MRSECRLVKIVNHQTDRQVAFSSYRMHFTNGRNGVASARDHEAESRRPWQRQLLQDQGRSPCSALIGPAMQNICVLRTTALSSSKTKTMRSATLQSVVDRGAVRIRTPAGLCIVCGDESSWVRDQDSERGESEVSNMADNSSWYVLLHSGARADKMRLHQPTFPASQAQQGSPSIWSTTAEFAGCS